MRDKYVIRFPIGDSLDPTGPGGRNTHRVSSVVFGIFFVPDPQDSVKKGTVVAGGPGRFRVDMLEALRLCKHSQAHLAYRNGSKERWMMDSVLPKRWERAVSAMRGKGWGLTKVRTFRHLMG